MKAHGGADVYIQIFFTLPLTGGERSASRTCRFTRGERATGTHWVGTWVHPRTGLDDVENRNFLTLPGLELRPLRCPVRRLSLYRLSYPGSHIKDYVKYTFACNNRNQLHNMLPNHEN
jgi:hypothetical protein